MSSLCVCRSRNSHRFDGGAPLFQGNQSSQATAWIPWRPRGLLLDDISPIFWNVPVGSCCELGVHEPTGHFVVIIISAVRIPLLQGT